MNCACIYLKLLKLTFVPIMGSLAYNLPHKAIPEANAKLCFHEVSAQHIPLSLLPPCQRIRRSSACHYLASQSITQLNAQPCQSEAESAAGTLPHMVAEPAAYTALEGQKALNRAQLTRITHMALKRSQRSASAASSSPKSERWRLRYFTTV